MCKKKKGAPVVLMVMNIGWHVRVNIHMITLSKDVNSYVILFIKRGTITYTGTF